MFEQLIDEVIVEAGDKEPALQQNLLMILIDVPARSGVDDGQRIVFVAGDFLIDGRQGVLDKPDMFEADSYMNQPLCFVDVFRIRLIGQLYHYFVSAFR